MACFIQEHIFVDIQCHKHNHKHLKITAINYNCLLTYLYLKLILEMSLYFEWTHEFNYILTNISRLLVLQCCSSVSMTLT